MEGGARADRVESGGRWGSEGRRWVAGRKRTAADAVAREPVRPISWEREEDPVILKSISLKIKNKLIFQRDKFNNFKKSE